jgi:phage repressor protein C with HTH and peptisase S24 domain
MEFKKQIESVLYALKKKGYSRSEIEAKLDYAENYIDQVLAKGGNKRFLSAITNLNERLLPKAITQKQRHQNTRNELKAIGEAKNGIQVYESAPTYASIKTVYHDEHAVPDYVLNIPQFRDCNYGTRASGDSMYPEIRNGDLIICKELPIDARIIFGDMYVVHTKDGIETIKYVNQFIDDNKNEPWVLLVPHNKAAGMGTPIPRIEIIKLFKVRAIFKAY